MTCVAFFLALHFCVYGFQSFPFLPFPVEGALVCISVGSSLLLEEPMDPVPEIFKEQFQFNFSSSLFPKLRFDSNSGFSFFCLF
jgi:hypothetical protein